MPRTLWRMPASSSTTRMVSSAVVCSLPITPPSVSVQDDLLDLPFHRQLDHETAAPRLVVFDPDESLMVGDDRRDDREAETRSALLRRKVGLEETRSRVGVDTAARVRDLERHDAHPAVIARADVDARLDAVRRRQRRDGVVEHVDDGALDALAVEREERQRRIGIEAETNVPMPFLEQQHRLLDDRIQVFGRVLARRHAGERRELVHQRLQLLDLRDDRARALLEEPTVVLQTLGVALVE